MEFQILKAGSRGIGALVDESAVGTPAIEVAGVPVAAPDDAVADGDAANVIGDGELSFERQGVFIALLNPGAGLAAVFGDGQPDGLARELEASGMVAFAVLHFDRDEALAGLGVKAGEEAFVGSLFHGRDPDELAFDIDALDVVGGADEVGDP